MTLNFHQLGQLFGRVSRPQTHKGTCGATPLFRAQKSIIANKAQNQDFLTLKISIFWLEILDMAFGLNLAVNYLLQFLNFDFGAFLAQLKRSFQENFAKNSPKLKFKNRRR